MQNLSCGKEFYLRENEKSFPHQRLSTQPHFDTEALENSEMVYYYLLFSPVNRIDLPFMGQTVSVNYN